jgi:hypothetical protein
MGTDAVYQIFEDRLDDAENVLDENLKGRIQRINCIQE